MGSMHSQANSGREILLFATKTEQSALLNVRMASISIQEQKNVRKVWTLVGHQ